MKIVMTISIIFFIAQYIFNTIKKNKIWRQKYMYGVFQDCEDSMMKF